MTAQDLVLTDEERTELERYATALDITTSHLLPPPQLSDWDPSFGGSFDDWADFCSSYSHEEAAESHRALLARLSALRKVLLWAEEAA